MLLLDSGHPFLSHIVKSIFNNVGRTLDGVSYRHLASHER